MISNHDVNAFQRQKFDRNFFLKILWRLQIWWRYMLDEHLFEYLSQELCWMIVTNSTESRNKDLVRMKNKNYKYKTIWILISWLNFDAFIYSFWIRFKIDRLKVLKIFSRSWHLNTPTANIDLLLFISFYTLSPCFLSKSSIGFTYIPSHGRVISQLSYVVPFVTDAYLRIIWTKFVDYEGSK